VIRVILDVNVFVSALIGPEGSPARRVLRAWIDGRIEVIASPQLVAEVEDVVLRPKFRRWFDEEAARLVVERLKLDAVWFEDPDPEENAPRTRDPKDDYLLALATAAKADAVVAGDLLEAEQDAVAVWTPRELLDRLG
jgi:putative PIN family toxin of toxin-antitoxin system